jgi:DNA polymerase III subunit epsilon
MRSLIFDTETTGLPIPSGDLDQQPKIIELAISTVVDGFLESKQSWLFNPEQPLSEEITKITGLKDNDLKDKQPFREMYGYVKEAFIGADNLIAHNAPFDVALLQFELERMQIDDFPWPPNIICTVAEYQHIFGFRPSLKDLYKKIIGVELAQTHRAQDDVDALVEILLKEGIL